MRLTDLAPRWLDPHLFVFLCPHCRQILLTCKDVPMPMHDQMEIYARELGEDDWNQRVVPSKQGFAWSIVGDRAGFTDLTVTPSIDASASGHWHGFIKGGEIK